MSMRIVIPTKGRVDVQHTLFFMAPELKKQVDLVCPAEEVRRHERQTYCQGTGVTVHAQPDEIKTISQKRAWIMREWLSRGHEKIVMLDDDLKSYIKRVDRPDRLVNATYEDQIQYFAAMDAKISPEFPHVGFGPRQGNNTQEPGWQSPGRMMFVLGYYLPIVLENAILDRVRFREDMDVNLQLLRAGFPNAVNHTFVMGQETGKYGAPGGCSDERDVDGSNEEAKKLAELHPGYVRLAEKDYKISVKRLEVVCSWAKALKDGRLARAEREKVVA